MRRGEKGGLRGFAASLHFSPLGVLFLIWI